jgi:hypothetical protein
VLLQTRQHPFALVRAALETLWLLVPLAIAAWGIAGIEVLRGAPGTWLVRIAFAVMLLLLARLAWRVLEWEFARVVVTTEKVIHVSGVLERRIASTPLSKVSEFSVRQPLVGRVFDYGALVVDVPGGREDALHGLGYLPDPTGMYRLVGDRARAGRVAEGGGRMRAPAPTEQDVARLQQQPVLYLDDSSPGASVPGEPLPPVTRDPWQRTLDGDAGDHTIQIPRVTPPDR